MDIREIIDLVNGYQSTGETSADESLLQAVQRLKSALVDIPQLGSNTQEALKALVRAAVVWPSEWNDILQLLHDALADAALSCAHRTLLLELLPGLLVGDSDVKAHGESVCDVLLQWLLATVRKQGESAGDSKHQEDWRAALKALLVLPKECYSKIVQLCASQLPQSLPLCKAILTNSSASDLLKRAFEEWLVLSGNASQHADCARDIERLLRENFSGFGSLLCEKACSTLLSSGSLSSMSSLRTLQGALQVVHAFSMLHREIVRTHVPNSFVVSTTVGLLDIVGAENKDDKQQDAKGPWPCIKMTQEESTLVVSILRSLVKLSGIVAAVPGCVSISEVRKLCAPLLAIRNEAAALDCHLPLVECVFNLTLRILSCVCAGADEMRELLQELVDVSNVMLPVLSDSHNQIESFGPFCEKKSRRDNHSGPGGKEKDYDFWNMSDEQQQTMLSALRVLRAVSAMCRVCRAQNRSKPEDKSDEEHWKAVASDIASAARTLAPSWKIEVVEQPRPTVTSNPRLTEGTTVGRSAPTSRHESRNPYSQSHSSPSNHQYHSSNHSSYSPTPRHHSPSHHPHHHPPSHTHHGVPRSSRYSDYEGAPHRLSKRPRR